MSDLRQALDNLIEAILESREYSNYQSLLDKLKRYPELKARIDEFRERNFELQQSDIDVTRLMEETDRFQIEYEKFRSDPLVNNFLSSELAFCRMMQEVFGEIMDNIHFD